jgi:hypothetical protein
VLHARSHGCNDNASAVQRSHRRRRQHVLVAAAAQLAVEAPPPGEYFASADRKGVPRARGDLRYAFIDLHNAHVPNEPWDVVRDCQTNEDWFLLETIYAAQLLQVWPALD